MRDIKCKICCGNVCAYEYFEYESVGVDTRMYSLLKWSCTTAIEWRFLNGNMRCSWLLQTLSERRYWEFFYDVALNSRSEYWSLLGSNDAHRIEYPDLSNARAHTEKDIDSYWTLSEICLAHIYIHTVEWIGESKLLKMTQKINGKEKPNQSDACTD